MQHIPTPAEAPNARTDRKLMAACAVGAAIGSPPSSAEVEEALLRAAAWGQAETVARILTDYGHRLRGPVPQVCALTSAAREGHLEVVEVLLRAGTKTNLGFPSTPLMLAAEYGHIEVARRLLRNGSARNARRDHLTPLHVAAEMGHVEMIELLLEAGAYVDRVGRGPSRVEREARYGWTPLFSAANGGHPEAITILLAAGANVHHVADDGSTSLIRAIAGNDQCVACIRQLLAAGAQVNHANTLGMTALHRAIIWRRQDIVRLLIQAGADVRGFFCRWILNNSTPHDYSSLCLAAWLGGIEIVEMLLECVVDVDHRTEQGETALDLARKHGSKPHVQAWQRPSDYVEIVEALSQFTHKA